MQEATGCEFGSQSPDELVRQITLHRAGCVSVPFIAFKVIDGHKGWLAAHGQAHIAIFEGCINLFAERIQILPVFIREGLGNAWMFGQPINPHIKFKIGLGVAGQCA